MERGGQLSWRSLGRLEKAFVLLLPVNVFLWLTGFAPNAQWWLAFLSFLLGVVVAFRLARRGLRKAIWRLRNRLIAAYIFIAVVPVVLILLLAGIASYVVIGQMAVYLVNTELRHRQQALLRSAESLALVPVTDSSAALLRFEAITRNSFPKFYLLINGRRELRYPPENTISQPPDEWNRISERRRASGLIVKEEANQDQLFAWAHVVENGEEVTVLAPVTVDVLATGAGARWAATIRTADGHSRDARARGAKSVSTSAARLGSGKCLVAFAEPSRAADFVLSGTRPPPPSAVSMRCFKRSIGPRWLLGLFWP